MDKIELLLAIVKAMYTDDNIRLRHKINRRMVDAIKPEIENYISQGVDEGVFDVPDVEDAAEMIILVMLAMRESTSELFLKLEDDPGLWPTLERKLRFMQTTFERVLGAPSDTICFIEEDVMRAYRRFFTNRKKERKS